MKHRSSQALKYSIEENDRLEDQYNMQDKYNSMKVEYNSTKDEYNTYPEEEEERENASTSSSHSGHVVGVEVIIKQEEPDSEEILEDTNRRIDGSHQDFDGTNQDLQGSHQGLHGSHQDLHGSQQDLRDMNNSESPPSIRHFLDQTGYSNSSVEEECYPSMEEGERVRYPSVEGEEEEEGAQDNKDDKKRRKPVNLCIKCPVCGGPAPDHLHFGGQCCYSCRAFFRRTSQRPISSFRCRGGKGDCVVSSGSKSCIPCRLTKCLKIGMDPSLIRGKKWPKKTGDESGDAVSPPHDLLPPPSLDYVGRADYFPSAATPTGAAWLKKKADMLLYEGMKLQYQANVLNSRADILANISSPSRPQDHGNQRLDNNSNSPGGSPHKSVFHKGSIPVSTLVKHSSAPRGLKEVGPRYSGYPQMNYAHSMMNSRPAVAGYHPYARPHPSPIQYCDTPSSSYSTTSSSYSDSPKHGSYSNKMAVRNSSKMTDNYQHKMAGNYPLKMAAVYSPKMAADYPHKIAANYQHKMAANFQPSLASDFPQKMSADYNYMSGYPIKREAVTPPALPPLISNRGPATRIKMSSVSPSGNNCSSPSTNSPSAQPSASFIRPAKTTPFIPPATTTPFIPHATTTPLDLSVKRDSVTRHSQVHGMPRIFFRTGSEMVQPASLGLL